MCTLLCKLYLNLEAEKVSSETPYDFLGQRMQMGTQDGKAFGKPTDGGAGRNTVCRDSKYLFQ